MQVEADELEELEREQKLCDDLFNDMIGNNIQYEGPITDKMENQ